MLDVMFLHNSPLHVSVFQSLFCVAIQLMYNYDDICFTVMSVIVVGAHGEKNNDNNSCR